MKVEGILETCLYSHDLDAADWFYGTVVGLERIARVPGRHVFFRCGSGMLLVFDPEGTSVESGMVGGAPVPPHGARGAGHVAFRVADSALRACREHLGAHGVAIESEIAWPSGGHSVYVRDPAGNSVEFATPDLWS